ncbi:phosphate uptake regulator PhoU [Candidatus Woesearchaeota archaeon]|nr:phosphate uptake regulator PhoU [Candidatus Woesearchaeota archaeon]
MRRKLVKQGAATMMVSLPSKWIKDQKLKKGDEVEISDIEGTLQISTEKKTEALKKEIKIATPAEYMNRLIEVPYMQGYDEITIHFEDAKVMDLVVKETEKLLGMELVNQTESSCTLKNVAEALEQEFDNIMRRLFLLVKSMAQESLDAAKEKDYQRLQNIADQERMCNKYSLFCLRLINKYGYKNSKEEKFVFHTIAVLEQLADHYTYICNHLVKTKEKIAPEILSFYKDVVALTDLYYQCFYKRERKNMLEMKELIDKLHRKQEKLLILKKNLYLTHYLTYIMEKTTHLSHFL